MDEPMVQWALGLSIVGLVLVVATAVYAIAASSSCQRHSPYYLPRQRVAGAVSGGGAGGRPPMI
jgi:hypothetical protein